MFPAQVTQLGTAADLLGEDACGRTNKDAAPGRLVGQPGIAGLLLAASQSCIWVFLEIIPLLSAFFSILQRRLCRNASLARKSTRQPIVDCDLSFYELSLNFVIRLRAFEPPTSRLQPIVAPHSFKQNALPHRELRRLGCFPGEARPRGRCHCTDRHCRRNEL